MLFYGQKKADKMLILPANVIKKGLLLAVLYSFLIVI